MDQAWFEAKQGAFRMLLILGEPGSGRSHLLDAWSERVVHEAQQFWAGTRWCPEEQTASPYLAGILHSHFQKHQFEQYEGLYQRIAALSKQTPEDTQNWQERAAALLDVWSAKQLDPRDLEDGLGWYIQTSATQDPVLLVLDDLFLLDRISRRFIELLLDKKPKNLMLVVLSSPGEHEGLLHRELQQTTQLELAPLTAQESMQMLQDRWPRLQNLHRNQIHQHIEEAKGNPRLLMAMIQSSMNQQESGIENTWLDGLSVPDSMEGVFLQRLRGLSSLEQDTLRKAALIGESFWQGAIENLERMELPQGNWGLREGVFISRVDDRSDCMQQLEEKNLIKRLPPSTSFEDAYSFQQNIFRKVLLHQIPPSIRKQMHQRVAAWLILHDEQHTLTDHIIEHLQQAGDTDRAAAFLKKAGDRAFQDGQPNEALRLYGDALEDANPENGQLRLQLLYKMAGIFQHVGDLSATIHLGELGLQLSWRMTSMRWGGLFHALLASCQSWRGDFIQAQDLLLSGKTLSQKANDPENRKDIEKEEIKLALRQGKLEDAQQRIKAFKHNHQPLSSPAEKASICALEGWYHRLQGRWGDAVNALEEANAISEDHGTPLQRGQIMTDQGELFLVVGDEESARTYLWEAANLLREEEANHTLIRTLFLAGHTVLLRREAQTALKWLQEAWRLSQAHGELLQTAQIAAALSASYVLAHKPKDAMHYARIAEQKLKGGSQLQQAYVYYFLGEAAAGLPAEQADSMLENPPSQLPEGGLPTYFFIKALELFENCNEKGRYCLALLGLGRALTARNLIRAANHVLERGIKDSEKFGLGLLLERLQNQQRLLSGSQKDADNAAKEYAKLDTQSTMVVRAPRKKKKNPSKRPTSSPPAPSTKAAAFRDETNKKRNPPLPPTPPPPSRSQPPKAPFPSKNFSPRSKKK